MSQAKLPELTKVNSVEQTGCTDWELINDQFVHIELTGGILLDDIQRLAAEQRLYSQFVDLDSNQPFLQLGNQVEFSVIFPRDDLT
jgi:hypothetical protein